MSMWFLLKSEQQKEIFWKLKLVAEAFGIQNQLKISAHTIFTNNLSAGWPSVYGTISISAYLGESYKHHEQTLRLRLQEALSGVDDANVDIWFTKVIGSGMGLIENVGFPTGNASDVEMDDGKSH